MKSFREFKVKVPNIPGISNAVWKSYIYDAVASWCGQAQAPQEGEEADEWWLMVESDRMDKVQVTSLRGGKKTLLDKPLEGKSAGG